MSCDLYFRQTTLKSGGISLLELGSNSHHMFLFSCMSMRLSFYKKVYTGLMITMFLLLVVVFLFTPNTYKSTAPVTFVNIRKFKDPDCFTCCIARYCVNHGSEHDC